MSLKILNVGVGVFTLVMMWTVALVLFIFTRKANKPVSTIGSGAIGLLLLITTIVVMIPKYSYDLLPDSTHSQDPLAQASDALDPDWKYIGRALLLTFDVIALIASVGLLFSKYLLRKIVR